MMVIAPYYRVSKKDKERGISIEVQQEAIARWIAIHAPDAVLVSAYIDDGVSAYTDYIAKRPAFQRLIADAHANKFTHILVYKFDRFARKRRMFFEHLDTLREQYKIE